MAPPNSKKKKPREIQRKRSYKSAKNCSQKRLHSNNSVYNIIAFKLKAANNALKMINGCQHCAWLSIVKGPEIPWVGSMNFKKFYTFLMDILPLPRPIKLVLITEQKTQIKLRTLVLHVYTTLILIDFVFNN